MFKPGNVNRQNRVVEALADVAAICKYLERHIQQRFVLPLAHLSARHVVWFDLPALANRMMYRVKPCASHGEISASTSACVRTRFVGGSVRPCSQFLTVVVVTPSLRARAA